MKVNKYTTRLAAAAFGFFAAFGGIGCIVTGMRFTGISMFPVAVVCAIAAAVFALTAGHRLFPAVPGVLLLIGWRLWSKGQLALSAEALVSQISRLYDAGYGWGVIRWSNEPLPTGIAQLALCALGVLIALGVCWSFIKSKSIWLSFLLTCLPVIPCMLLTDTVPAPAYLYIQLLCLVLLLMIRLAKKQGKAASLLKLLALPVAAAVLVLFWRMPQAGYSSIPLADSIVSYVQEFFSDGEKEQPNTPARQESSWIDLSAIGPKAQRRNTVMEVTAQRTGYLYLRGISYDAYYGTWWDSKGLAAPQPATAPTSTFSVTVTTTAMHDVLYLPYRAFGIGSGNGVTLAEENGCVKNTGLWRRYMVNYKQLPAYDENWELPTKAIPNQFLQLPTDTQKAAQDYLKRELPELETMTGIWSRANAIVDHVSRSASYNLRTSRMPTDAEDFALWFLEESNSGYCVHFATAATVLLRAAGIPCRYVTSYLVYTRADQTVSVIQNNAHAWVECYIADVGWVPLEPTPAGGITQTTGSEHKETTETTETTEATETTETTETATSAPTETTETIPTAPTQGSTAPTAETSAIGGADDPAAVPREFPGWLKWVLGILAAALMVISQWRLRVWLRLQKRSRGRKNAQALARWQEVTLHARIRKQEPDRHLLELAQKAKFSHHAITREELKEFDTWLVDSKQAIRQMGLWQNLLATLLYALY